MKNLMSILILMLTVVAISIMALIPQAHAQVSLHVTLVVDAEVGTHGRGVLYRVDPSTGHRTIISDFGKANQGPVGESPFGVAIDTSGDILVIDSDADISDRREFKGALFRVNPSTGERSILSDFGNPFQGPLGVDPIDVAIDLSGTIFVLDRNAGTNGRGALFRVDLLFGFIAIRTV